MAQIFASLGTSIWMFAAFVVALSIIVFIHEMGHYLVGRWTGIHADVFSLGFGKVLISRTDRRGTIWQIAAVPFGGYVKFAGDANASGGTDMSNMADLTPQERRRTMNGAPLWARSATVLAGPMFNFISAALIYVALVLYQGTTADPLQVDTVAILPGDHDLRSGDVILQINGQDLPGYDDAAAYTSFWEDMPVEASLPYRVERDGQEVDILGPYARPAYVQQLAPRGAAIRAGMQQGDVITAINGVEIASFDELKDAVETSQGATLDLTIWNDGQIRQADLTPKQQDEPLPDGGFQTVYRIGIVGGLAFEPGTAPIPFIEALQIGVSRTWVIITTSFDFLGRIVAGQLSTCNLSGPIGMAQAAGDAASQGLVTLILMIAQVSIGIGIVNLLPIPVLDGGHLVFHAYEAAFGKPPSDRVLNVLMMIGLMAVLSMMIFATSQDLFC